MRKRREVTEIMSQSEFDEREELIKNITKLGSAIVDVLGLRRPLRDSIVETREVTYEEKYQRRRFLRKSVIDTRPAKKRLGLVLMLSRPYIWLTIDKRFALGNRRDEIHIVDLSIFHVKTLRALHECMQGYHDSLFKR